MKKIAIYCVTYNSYDALLKYLLSLDFVEKGQDVSLTVYVADNTETAMQNIDYKPTSYKLSILQLGKNLGYFGAIFHLMEKFTPLEYDYSIISNVDLTLNNNLFHLLANLKMLKHCGWIAPSIISKSEGRDKNPKILKRYNKKKLFILSYLFKYPWLYNLYTHTIYKRKKYTKRDAMKIYAGHGSFIILTKEYFKRCGIIDYPVFLFCEEIYLGEQCIQHGLKVKYEPSLVVYDTEHVSTGTFKNKQYCQYNYKAIKYIINKYYSK